MAADPYRYFRPEAREIVERLGAGAIALEKGDRTPDPVPGLLRHAHTLKGAARVVRQGAIADLAHAIEDVLEPLRRESRAAAREEVDRLLALVDEIGARVAALSPPPQSQPHGVAPQTDDTFRPVHTEIGEIDVLLQSLAEIVMRMRAHGRLAADIERARTLADLAGGGRHAEELRGLLTSIERDFAGSVESLERELQETQAAAERLQLVPAGSIFPSLERTARDVARTLGRRAQFDGRGGALRLEAGVLAVLQPAIVQLVRNAVAHGVESPAERTAAGKHPAARVTVELIRRGKQLVVRCQDDGRGIDLDAVRLVAGKQGLSDEATLTLLFRGGVTTSQSVTHTSGRGVGLDVVREALDRLGGELSVRTDRGRGTVVELLVPLSLAALDVLLAQTSGITVAIPVECVMTTMRVPPAGITRTPRGSALVHEGVLVPFVPLARALGLPEGGAAAGHGRREREGGLRRPAQHTSAVVVRAHQRLAALGVERLQGTASVIVRPLPAAAPAKPVVSGAVLGVEGLPQLVLDPDALIGAALAAGAPDPTIEGPAPPRPVLVIDDSMTTRMLEQSILESAGYAVDVAASAEEALAMARRKDYALFVVDVEMPGMDGFTFVEVTRADPVLRNTPAILVTSRDADADRRRGEAAGASAYLIKSELDQTELLRIIGGLVA